MDLSQLTAKQIVSRIKSRELSATEVIKHTLDRIERLDGQVGAFLSVHREQAAARARAIDDRLAAGDDPGPLAGLPVAVKDNICTRGTRTTCASHILEHYQPPYDAGAVERLEAAGAVIVGKTNLDEFAMGSTTENSGLGQTRNPWELDHVPGGSSGGSAAAVAARLTSVSLGSDTGGSIRQPAGFCGVCGLKPTYGRVSRYGLVAFGSSLDQIGPFATDVHDIALLLSAIAGHDERDSTSVPPTMAATPDFLAGLDNADIKGLKVGLPKEYYGQAGLNAEVSHAVGEAIEQIKAAGAETVEVSLPHTDYAVACYYLIATAEASSNLARYDGVHYGYRTPSPSDLIDLYSRSRAEALGDEVKRRIMLGTYVLSAGYYEAYYLKALKVRTLIKRDFERAFGEVDVICSPVSPTPAFRIGETVDDPLAMYLSDIYTISANLAAIPGLSVPCGLSRAGLPIGLQILGRHFDEPTVLRVGAAYQARTDHHRQRPPIASA